MSVKVLILQLHFTDELFEKKLLLIITRKRIAYSK